MTGDPANLFIAPMLFIPFVENAFKHAESKKKENAISISVCIEKEACTFECENMYAAITEDSLINGGLGNDLIQKRLNLLYPGRHKLEMRKEKNIYKVKLQVYYDVH
jgi:two-component system LytT family sensor kinase